jgi:amino acid transporter
VEDPGRVLPRALGWSVIMVFLAYFVPLLVALGASSAEQHEWVDGYFSTIALEIGGPWLAGWLVFAAGISNIAMFQAELSGDAFQIMGMAEHGYLPKIFATRSRHGTPTYGILLCTLVIICMTVASLDKLIEMLNFNHAISLLLEYLSFLKLRISRPDLERPYRVPLNTVGCIILFTPPLLATLVIVGLASFETYLFFVAFSAFGLLIFAIREHKVCQRYSLVDDTTVF